jgi:hypothetical protein
MGSAWGAGLRALAVVGWAVYAAGAAHAQLAVAENGAANYSYPLRVPPGIAGMEPKLVLNYNSASGATLMGAGWSLQGLSTLSRCITAWATDGRRSNVTYTPADKLCLDGKRLIPTNEAGAPQTSTADAAGVSSGYREFRLEKDEYARIRAYGVANGDVANGPAYFRVWTKSGQIYEYGNTTDSRVELQGRNVVQTWNVNRVSDTVGNYMDIQYAENSVSFGTGTTAAERLGKESYPVRIRYTGNGSQAPANDVVFNYESRPDKREAYHGGSKVVNTVRLKTIQTRVNNATTPVLTYHIEYDEGPHTKRSRITSIRQCAGSSSTNCLPETIFNWSPGATLGMYEVDQRDTNVHEIDLWNRDGSNGSSLVGFIDADFDGDGKTDLLRWHHDPTQNQLWLSNGNGTFRQSPYFNLTNEQLGNRCRSIYLTSADINGDGRADLVRVRGRNSGGGDGCGAPSTQTTTVFLANADGTFTTVDAQLPLARVTPRLETGPDTPEEWPGVTFDIADFTGDGWPDILVRWSQVGQLGHAICVGELTCFYRGNGNGTFTKIATNMAQVRMYVPNYAPPPNNGRHSRDQLVMDTTGDGVADVISMDKAWASLGNGNFVEVSVEGCAKGEMIDLNGDGRADCADFTHQDAEKPIKVSKGVGTTRVVANLPNDYPYGGLCNPESGMGCNPDDYPIPVDIVSLDANGDGLSDFLLVWKFAYTGSSSRNNRLFLNNGNQSFTEVTGHSLQTYLLRGRTDYSFILGDFLGNGSPQMLRYSHNLANNRLLVSNEPLPGDLLTSVLEPAVGRSEVRYKPLTDTSVHLKFSNAVWPQIDLAPAMWVAHQVSQPDGVGGQRVTDYRYSGLRIDAHGRGVLGFYIMDVTSPAPDGTPVTTRTRFRQDFPYIGLPSSTHKYLTSDGEGRYLTRSTSTYVDLCPTAGSPRLYRPALQNTVEESFDLSRTRLPQVTLTREYNCYGDITRLTAVTEATVVGTPRTYTKVTTNTYQAAATSGDQWQLGRLTRATVQTTEPDILLSTSAGSAALATATQGQAVSLAISPASVTAHRVTAGPLTAQATANLSTPTGPVTYAWSRVSGSRITVSGAATATFSATMDWNESFTETFRVTATDDMGVVRTQNVSVQFSTPPRPVVSLSASPAAVTVNRTSPGTATGSVSVSASGGATPYSYSWARISGSSAIGINSATSSAPQFSANLAWGSNLSATYRLTVTDGHGTTSQIDVPVTMTAPAEPVVNLNPSTLQLNGTGDGVVTRSVTATAAGGVAPYTYAWTRLTGSRVSITGASSATPSFSVNLGWGENLSESYRVTMTDAAGNAVTRDLPITATTPVQLQVETSPAGILQANRNNPGTVSTPVKANVSGGTAPYTYQWTRLSGSRYSFNAAAGYANTFTATVGWGESFSETFRVTVRDANQRSVSRDFTVSTQTPPPLVVSISPTSLSATAYKTCDDFSEVFAGTAAASASGGVVGPYIISWSRSNTNNRTTGGWAPSFYGGSSPLGYTGTTVFTATVTDSVGNQATAQITVTTKVISVPGCGA